MTATKIWFCWITAQTDRTEHAVADGGQLAGTGVFKSLCGLIFLPASMDVGPERRCAGCAAQLRARRVRRCAGRSRGRHAA